MSNIISNNFTRVQTPQLLEFMSKRHNILVYIDIEGTRLSSEISPTRLLEQT